MADPVRNSVEWHIKNTYALLRQNPMTQAELIRYCAEGYAMRDETIRDLNETVRALVHPERFKPTDEQTELTLLRKYYDVSRRWINDNFGGLDADETAPVYGDVLDAAHAYARFLAGVQSPKETKE